MAEFVLDLNPDIFDTIADLGSVLHLDVLNPDSALFLQAASLHKGKCVTAEVPGFKIVSEQPKLASCPLIIRQSGGAEDFVALCFKASHVGIYLLGLSVTALKEWQPPTKGDESEEAVLRCINLKHPSLLGAVELVNTETVKLKDMTEALLERLPSFNRTRPPRMHLRACVHACVERTCGDLGNPGPALDCPHPRTHVLHHARMRARPLPSSPLTLPSTARRQARR